MQNYSKNKKDQEDKEKNRDFQLNLCTINHKLVIR